MDRTRTRVAVSVACTLVIIGLVAVGAGRMQRAQDTQRLTAIAASEAADIQAELGRLVELGTAVALAVRERPVVDQAGFDALLEGLGLERRFATVEAIAVLEPVAREDLAGWWAARRGGAPPAAINRDAGGGQLLLVAYGYPSREAELLTGVDLTALEATFEAASRTMASGEPHLSRAAELVVLGPDTPGATLHVPLTDPDGTIRGTIVIGLSGQSFLDALLPLPGAVHVTIREPTSQRYPVVAEIGPEPWAGRGATVATHAVGLPSSDWVVEVRPTAGFATLVGRWIVELTFGAGLLVAGLVGLAVYGLASREQAASALAAARTRDLEVANERLRHTDAIKDRFLAAVSHELRTPLTVIAGIAETLRRLPPDAAAPGELLDPLDRNVRRLDVLVGDVLLLAGLDAGALRLRVEPIRLDRELRRLAADHGPVGVELDVPEHLVAWSDPRHLDRILSNLLANAVRHGAPPIEVAARAEGDAVRLSVRDHGPGLGDEQLATLTERFARGSRADRSTGTGLGLALARELVEHAGGRLWVEDAGPGARFVVVLPTAAPPGDPSGQPALSGQAGTGAPEASSTGPPIGS